MTPRTTVLAAAAILATGAVLGGGATAVVKNAKIDRIERAHAVEREQAATEARQAIEAAQARTHELQQAVADSDRLRTEEKANAQAEIDRLRADVVAGRQRLRVNATCTTKPGPGVPAPASPASVDDGGAPRLTDAAERHYFDLRSRIATANAQILALQDYARACQSLPR